MTAKEIEKELTALANPEIASHSRRFFKTGPGEYGEGDRFRGIRVPVLRNLAKRFSALPRPETLRLLRSSFHEDRLLALFLLVQLFEKGNEKTKADVFKCYLANARVVNNWDLVDASAEHIVGAFLMNKDKGILHRLAKSAVLWERRISIMSTFHFIKNGQFDETLAIAKTLLEDREDLIHKAVGWMLREVGKRDLKTEERFLKAHCKRMPRTMLRYAIERFSEENRRAYLRAGV